MKRKLLSSLLLLSTTAFSQDYTYFTEYFDDQATAITGTQANAATTPTQAAIKTGTWTTYYSFRAGSGCASYNDPTAAPSPKFIRLLNTASSSPSGLSSNSNGPYAYIISPTLPFGVSQVTWRNNQTNTSGSVSVYSSTNDGASWTLVQTVPTVSTASCGELYSVTITNGATVNKIKFQNETTSNQELDNITFFSVQNLPVTFSSIKASQKGSTVQIDWSTATEVNVNNYVVERSIDGSSFSMVANVMSKGNSTVLSSYTVIDALPLNGNNFYRIKAVDKDGKLSYTSIVKVNLGKSKVDMVVAPNPVKGGELNVQLSSLTKGTYLLKLYNTTGQEIFSKQVFTDGGSLTQTFSLPATVKPGIYNLQLNGNEIRLNKKVIVD